MFIFQVYLSLISGDLESGGKCLLMTDCQQEMANFSSVKTGNKPMNSGRRFSRKHMLSMYFALYN